MKQLLINFIIFGIFITLGHIIASYCNVESLKLDIMFLFGVLGCACARMTEFYSEKEEKDETY